jgi:hypothetical protein
MEKGGYRMRKKFKLCLLSEEQTKHEEGVSNMKETEPRKELPAKKAKGKRERQMSQVKVIHVNGPPTHIPDTPAGQLCIDVFRSLAKKMLNTANEATDEFILSNFPGAITIGKEYADRKIRRTIEWSGEQINVIYDFMTDTASIAQ